MRLLLHGQRAFPIAMVLTLAIALLPAGALGWVKPLAEIAGMIVMPFAEVGNAVAHWVRPPQSAINNPQDVQALEHYKEQMVEFERLYVAEQARADELERRLQQLQNAPADMPRYPVKLILARIGARAAFEKDGSVVINRGNKDGVTINTVAVHDHVHLVGWITDVAPVTSTLSPLAGVATRAMQGAVLAKDRPPGAVALANAPRLALTGSEGGVLIAEPDNSLLINPGDEVVLIDEDWPRGAQAMKIGTVESVRPNDQKPLRNIVVVRPHYRLDEVRMVVLRIDDEAGSAGTSP